MKNKVIFGVYGISNSGKTTLIEKLITELTKDGYKLATIKVTNKKLGIDEKGKDTWKHSRAGAKLVVLSSQSETDILLKKELEESDIVDIISKIDGFDVLIIEGSKDKNIPKIRIGNIEMRENTIFDYKDNFEEILKFIKAEIKSRSSQIKDITIIVNGKKVPLSEFPALVIKNGILGMLNSLKGVNKIKDATINLSIE
jgi:molybdopterin-guanine dinucleotide biosynthesis protein MobB